MPLHLTNSKPFLIADDLLISGFDTDEISNSFKKRYPLYLYIGCTYFEKGWRKISLLAYKNLIKIWKYGF